MFYRSKEHIKAQLEDRLRTALAFATLEAYEPETADRPAGPHGPQPRVFLFAKVAAPCPHGPDPTRTCDAAGSDVVEHRTVAMSAASVGTRRRTRRSRRGGAVKVAPQPCTWAVS